MRHKALHILAPHEWDVFAEALAIGLNKTVPVPILFGGHASEQIRCRREIGAERLREVAIDARVFFFGGDGQGEYLRFVQVPETHCKNHSKELYIRRGKSNRIPRTVLPYLRLPGFDGRVRKLPFEFGGSEKVIRFRGVQVAPCKGEERSIMKIEQRSYFAALTDRLSQRAWRLESGQLCARARRKAGLENFGEPSVEPALDVLTKSLENEANLHPLGRLLMRIHLQGILHARLKLAKLLDAAGRDAAASPGPPPIFITGMPRSGSTFLHELLIQDPALRAPRVWEVISPADAVKPDRGWRDLRIWRAAWCLWWFRRLAPRPDTVYPMRARTPHECVAIHSYTFLSEEFISTCHVPAYEAFLRSTDLRPAYAWQKRFLHLLQSNRPGMRWVLKSPDHARDLEALFAVFPDALVIQTHRSPLESLRSSIQLTEVLQKFYARPQSRDHLARREARNLAGNMQRLLRFRDEHPEVANRFVDVNYSELAADPLMVVRRIYRHFEMPLSNDTVARMQQLARGRSAYKRRRSAPTLAEVQMNPRTHVILFGEYCRRFGIPAKPASAS